MNNSSISLYDVKSCFIINLLENRFSQEHCSTVKSKIILVERPSLESDVKNLQARKVALFSKKCSEAFQLFCKEFIKIYKCCDFQVSGRLSNTGHGIVFYTESPSNNHQVRCLCFYFVSLLFLAVSCISLRANQLSHSSQHLPFWSHFLKLI